MSTRVSAMIGCRSMILSLLLTIMPGSATLALAATSYHVVDIGTTGTFTTSIALGINDSGVVVGALSPGNTAYQFTEGGGFVLLDNLAGGSEAIAFDVNDAGVVVGRSNVTSGDTQAAIWSTPTTPLQLNSIGGSNFDTAFDINASGEAAGSAVFIGIPFDTSAVFWSDTGVPTDLSAELNAQGSARALNDAGVVVGIFETAVPSENRAFQWTEASGVDELVGLQGALRTEAYGINSAGVAVGTSGAVDTPSNATRWTTPTTPEDLGLLPGSTRSVARAINDDGTIVGIAETLTSQLAFVWTETSGLEDLNDVSDAADIGMTLLRASAINSSGQIVGTGLVGGVEHAFIAPEFAAAWPALGVLAWLYRNRLARRA